MKSSFVSRMFSMHPLAMIAGVCLIALTIPAYRLLDAERQNVGAVPRAISQESDKTRGWVRDEIVAKQVMPALRDAASGLDGRVESLEVTTDHRVSSIEDRLFGELHQVAASANDRTVDVLAVVNGLKQKLEPALDHIASITAKADEQSGPILANVAEASKELPPALRDGRFLLARSARTVGHIEQMADKIEAAVPGVLGDVDSIGQSFSSIAADAKREADEITAPKKWWQKLLGPIYTAARVIAMFL